MNRMPAYVIRPAGQAYPSSSVTFNPDGSSQDTSGHYWDAQGNPISGPPAPVTIGPPPGGNVTPGPGYVPPPDSTIGKVPGTTMSQADQTALFNTVASGLNTAGSTIAAIINSGDRMQIAQLQNQTALQIAQLQSQAQQASASGNTALAAQQAQQAQQMQMFAQLLQQRNATTNTPMYILAGLAGLGILGAIVYFVSSRPKANPSVGRISEVPYAPYYVIGHDTFMSGWGEAAGKQNWVILPAETYEEAERVRRNAKSRTDQRRVKIITRQQLQRMRMGARHWSLMTKSDAGRWYSAEGFGR